MNALQLHKMLLDEEKKLAEMRQARAGHLKTASERGNSEWTTEHAEFYAKELEPQIVKQQLTVEGIRARLKATRVEI